MKLSDLKGKTIEKASIKGYDKSEGEYDDKPFLFLTMTDGTVYRVEATYGGYTGYSKDEYPCLIKIKKVRR